MPAAIQVTGLKELRSALKRVDATAPKELARVNHEVGQIVVDEAKRLAPKGPHQGGGSYISIENSIRANQVGTNVTIIVGGPRTPYAVVTEFGGRIPRRGNKGGGRASSRVGGSGGFTRVRRQPYLYEAIKAKKGEVEGIYVGLLDALAATFQA